MQKISFLESFLISITSFFTEISNTLKNGKTNLEYSFSKHSRIPIVRIFHEALKPQK